MIDTLRVMTFNIRGSFYRHDGMNVWTNRAALNIATILQADPDIIGFQEAQRGNLETYQTAQLSIHLDLLDSGGFWLSLTPHQWSKDWDSVCGRRPG